MRFTLYTLFPSLVTPYLSEAILGRAVREGIVEVVVRDLRRFAGNRTGRVDDAPYGGGAGMVIRVDVAAAALDEVAADDPPPEETILLSPAGAPLTQATVRALAGRRHVAVLAGRYEGFDARVERMVTREVSIGDFVLMGGELPALCLLEAVVRLLPGALGDADSHRQESFSEGLLDYPEYTRPATYRGADVPDVLVSGHHGRVATWRRTMALARTFRRRPELLDAADLSGAERALVEGWRRGETEPPDEGEPTSGAADRV